MQRQRQRARRAAANVAGLAERAEPRRRGSARGGGGWAPRSDENWSPRFVTLFDLEEVLYCLVCSILVGVPVWVLVFAKIGNC